MANYCQYPPKCNKEECGSPGIVSDTMKSPTNLSCGNQRMGMQTGEDKKWLMLITCCKIQGWETRVNCRQSWWTEGAGRAGCSTRGVLKDDQDEKMIYNNNIHVDLLVTSCVVTWGVNAPGPTYVVVHLGCQCTWTYLCGSSPGVSMHLDLPVW